MPSQLFENIAETEVGDGVGCVTEAILSSSSMMFSSAHTLLALLFILFIYPGLVISLHIFFHIFHSVLTSLLGTLLRLPRLTTSIPCGERNAEAKRHMNYLHDKMRKSAQKLANLKNGNKNLAEFRFEITSTVG